MSGRRAVAAAVGTAMLATAATACTSAGGSEGTATTTIGVVAAVSLAGPFTELVEEFEAANPDVRVKLELGPSVTNARALPGRTDLHLFVVAGDDALDLALSEGLVEDPVSIARNHVVLAVPTGNPANVTGLSDLTRPDVRLGLCVEEGPCGTAARTLLSAAGVDASAEARESDSPALARTLADAALDAGIVYRTDVAASRGWVTQIDGSAQERELASAAGATEYRLAAVPAGLGDGNDDEAERRATDDFRALVTSDRGREVLDEGGFLPVED